MKARKNRPGKLQTPPPRQPLPGAKGVRPLSPYFLSAVALVALSLLAYSNSFQGGFVLDNSGLLLHDTRVRQASAENIGLIVDHTYWWPNGESGLYRPFATLSYLFNYSVLGNREQPAGYHWINFLLHSGNVLLVYALAVRLIQRFWPAFFVAALWAVHPVHTEAVTNVAGRTDLLAAGAVLAALLCYLKSVEAQGGLRLAWLAGLVVATTAGVFSKESAVIIPGVIVLYEVAFGAAAHQGKGRRFRALTPALLATLAPVALMLWQRSRVLSGTLPMEIPFTDNPIAGADFLTGRLTALGVIGRYLSLIAWPANLSADYSWSQIPLAHAVLRDWLAAIPALALVPATVFLYRRNRAAFFFLCLGLLWLAPVSNLFFPIGTIMAERFLYLPALGFIACLVPAIWAVAERVNAARYAPALFCLVVTALAIRTWARNADWKDDRSIAAASVRTSARSFKTHDLLANVLFASDASHANIDRVIEESEKSRAILDSLPDRRKPPDPWRFASECYMIRKAYGKATAALLQFIAIEKAELADFRNRMGQMPAPADSVERENNLRQADALLLLSSAYLAEGDTDRAAQAIEQARVIDPLSSRLYLLTADIASSAERMDDAAIALVEGAFITSDKTIRGALVDLYRSAMDPTSCALIGGPKGLAINPRCAIVHAHVCAASVYTVRTLAASERRDLAQTRKRMFIEQFGCPKEPLEDVLP
jgi:protein O-mannosyl-transferase